MIFQNSPNITRRFAARDILVNFEISLAVFIPNTPRNHAITYTNSETDLKPEFEGDNFRQHKIVAVSLNDHI